MGYVSLLALIFGLLFLQNVNSKVFINEVMLSPRQGADYEYVELYNSASTPVDLSGWTFKRAFTFIFPNFTVIEGHGFVIATNNREAFLTTYPKLKDITYGDFIGAVIRSEVIELTSEDPNNVKSYIKFPANVLVDDFGCSWENRCPKLQDRLLGISGDAYQSTSVWVPSVIPMFAGINEEYSGTPGDTNSWLTCAPELPVPPKIFISEIMYNPVNEITLEQEHEFVELYNPNSYDVEISNWQLIGVGSLRYIFDQGTVIAANSYLVVAKKIAALTKVYSIPKFVAVGDYTGELNNGGDLVALVDDNRQVVDFIDYNDQFPWPLSTNAFGASQKWLPNINQSAYQFKGVSLNRISFLIASNSVNNWIDDFPTPASKSLADSIPLPVVEDYDLDPSPRHITSSTPVTVTAEISEEFDEETITLVYQVWDPIERKNVGSQLTLQMLQIDSGDSVYSTVLPEQPTGMVVKFKFVGNNAFVSAPKASDPYEWFQYHVNPEVNTTADFYQVYLPPASWAQLWYNIKDGKIIEEETGNVTGCNVNPNWTSTEDGTIVFRGEVCDCKIRLLGNWAGSPTVTNWPYPGPAFVNDSEPFRVLNFRVELPEYCTYGGDTVLLFHKVDRSEASCTQLASSMLYNIMEDANQLYVDTDYVRLHVNGGYYRYSLKIEIPEGGSAISRYFKKQQTRCPNKAPEQEAWLFKNSGCWCEDGPYSKGDYRVIQPNCGYSALERYSATFELESLQLQTKGSQFIMDLTQGLNDALDSDNKQTAKQFLSNNFDVSYMLTHFAIMAWASASDDRFHNHYLVRRRSDNKYIMLAWDYDYLFTKSPQQTVFYGGIPEPGDDPDDYSRLKKIFFWAFRDEYLARLEWVNDKVMSELRLTSLATSVAANWQYSELSQVLTPYFESNDMNTCYNKSLKFIDSRSNYIKNIDSSYDPKTYVVDECLDSPNIVPVFSAYESVPGKPSKPVAVLLGTNATYQITWYPANPNGDKITSYELFARVGDQDTTRIYVGTALTTQYTAPSVTTKVSFSVRAKNSFGFSPFSAYVSPTLPKPPVSTFPNANSIFNFPISSLAKYKTGIVVLLVIFAFFFVASFILGIILCGRETSDESFKKL